MQYQTTKLEENDERKVYLDNEQIPVSQFNNKLESLKKNQRVVESSDNNFHIVERMFS
jgi:hypothetical protein